MTVGLCTISLALPAVHSLKEKRGMLKPLIAHLRKEFNVSVAEVEEQDRWQASGIAIAIVGSEGANLHGTLEGIVGWIERTQPHLYVANWDIEIL